MSSCFNLSDSAWKFSSTLWRSTGMYKVRTSSKIHVVTAFIRALALAAQYQELGGADAGSVVDILLDEVRRVVVGRAGGAHQIDGVTGDALADRHHADQLLEVQDLLGVGHRVGIWDGGHRRQVHHLEFFFGREVIEDGVEQEAVELRFGKGVGAFQFDGVLGCQYEEGAGSV